MNTLAEYGFTDRIRRLFSFSSQSAGSPPEPGHLEPARVIRADRARWDAEDGLGTVYGVIEELFLQGRFNDCTHQAEPGCAIQAAIDAGDSRSVAGSATAGCSASWWAFIAGKASRNSVGTAGPSTAWRRRRPWPRTTATAFSRDYGRS